MKHRYIVGRDGMLVDRHGNELGRLVSLTIDVREEGDFKGGVGCVEESDLTSKTKPTSKDGGVGETKPGDVCPHCRNGTLEAAGSLLVCPSCGANVMADAIDVPVQRRLGEDGEPVALLSEGGEIECVWEHYVEVMAPRRKQLDPAARAVIREALKVATLVESKRAIDGCHASAFHMGENDRGKKYNRLSQILKGKRGIRTTREQIDLFLDIAEKSGVAGGSASVDPDRLQEAKLNVLTAHDFPGNELAMRNGEMSAAWLAQHGYRVVPDPQTGRPTFHLEGE